MQENKKQTGQGEKSTMIRISDQARPPFAVPTTLYVDAVRKGEKVRFSCNLLGWVAPEYLLASATYDSGIMLLPVKTQLVVRYLYNGQIYGFQSLLMHKQGDPFPLWFLRFPDRVEAINLRISPRYPVFIEMKDARGNTYMSRDLSTGGTAVVEKAAYGEEISMGYRLQLDFRLPDGTAVEKIQTEVVRIYQDRQQRVLGLKFTASDTPGIRDIQRFIESIRHLCGE